MSMRSWDQVTVPYGNTYVGARRIKCFTCENTAVFRDKVNGGAGTELTATYFRNHGWTVGKYARADRCPDCSAKKPKLTVVRQEEIVSQAAAAPREPTIEEKQMIFTQLQEVYQGGGYVAGWTDAKVAATLDYPIAWVEPIRAGFFGEAGSNPEIDRFLTEVEELRGQMAEVSDQYGKLRASMQTYEKVVNAMAQHYAELTKHAERIQRLAKVK